MADYTITLDADPRQVLQAFQQLERNAQETGQVIGQRIDQGIERFSTSSLAGLQAELNRLQQRQLTVGVNTAAFDALGRKIADIQEQIQATERQRLSINVDPTSINGLNTKLSDLRDELNRVSIGSDRFRELKVEIEATERQLSRASESTDRFRVLDGVVQGIAFSLSNAVVNAAGQAFQAVGNLIGGFAKLDTEIRKAAAAGGDADGYGKLSGAINAVGIEAAGTQQQVAELATELVRGGLSIDQTTAALGGIVRGAEATGTAYSAMGSVVTATLTGFGLDARETTRVVDALVTGANSSATSVEGMGGAFKYAAPVARVLGVSVEELGVAIGLMTNAGITAEEAGVTLRNGLSKLASAAPQAAGGTGELTGQARQAAEAMAKLGINIYETNGTLRPMEEVLLQLKGAFDQLDPASKIRLAANLFGGEDDGTKWLALLSQSEGNIRAMSAAMASTQGATATARDAMQGFELTVSQLTGTLDSLGNNVGRVAAAGLLPLVQAANALVGAIAGLPEPVRDTVIAISLLAAGVATATAAYVVFKGVLALDATRAAITGAIDLTRAIGTTLVGGITSAAAAMPALIAQLSALGATNVGQAIAAVAASLQQGFVAAITAASASLSAFVASLTSLQLGTFIAGVQSAVVALAPLALAIGAVTAAVIVWRQTFADSSAVSDTFSEAQKTTSESLVQLRETLKITKPAVTESLNEWQRFANFLSEWRGMLELQQQFERFQGKLTATTTAALDYYNSIKDINTLSAEQVERSKSVVGALLDQNQAIDGLIAKLRAQAQAQEEAGKPELAQQIRDRVTALETEKATNESLITAYRNKVPAIQGVIEAQQREARGADELNKLTRERIEAERDLNLLLAAAPQRFTEGQLAIGRELTSLVRALGDLEQSRFGVAGAALDFELRKSQEIAGKRKESIEFELQKAQERGASEQEIGRIKEGLAAAEKAALNEQAAIRTKIETNDRVAWEAKREALVQQQELERVMLGLSQEKARLDANIEVLEQRSRVLEAQDRLQRAANDDERRAAQAQISLQQQILTIRQGKLSLLNQTQPLEQFSLGIQQETANNTLAAQGYQRGWLQVQRQTTEAMEQASIRVTRLKDGTIVITNEMRDGVNRQASALSSTIRETAGTHVNALVQAFVRTNKSAEPAVQGAFDFKAHLTASRTVIGQINQLNLGGKMEVVADETGRAARAAGDFYAQLQRASNLPGSRWSGGPVEAGAEYRINELGQEAFLSAGRLSLIDAPANSIWRAPSEGVVIPAGITARLQTQAAISASGGGSIGAADLAIEIGKLREEVGNLARRDWSVRVTQRTGPTGSQVLRTLLS